MIALTALGVLALAVLVGWVAGHHPPAVPPPRPARWRTVSAVTSWWLCAVGSAGMVLAGGRALAGHGTALVLVHDQLGPLGLRVDGLAGMFLVIAFSVAVPAVIAAATVTAGTRPRLPAAIALTLGCTALIIAANNLFLLIAAWEGLGFAFYLVIGHDRHRPGRAWGALLAVGFSKISVGFLLVGGLLAAAQSHTLAMAGIGHGVHGAAAGLSFALLVIGFAIKVGLVPLHPWLPPAYSAAPPAARAILAGAAVNVGFYGLWRTLDVLGRPPAWLAGTVLVVAGAGALLGITHASVHARLMPLIAWSSVENAGMILAGYGVALVGAVIDDHLLVAAGLVAATAQICAHALGKTLLFVSAGDIETAFGRTDLDGLRGVAFRRPLAGTGLIVGAFTLAGLPLTAGFASEWLTLEALMQQFRLGSSGLKICTAVGAILVALTIGVAGVTFVRLIGLTAFARPAAATPAGPRRGSVPFAIGVLALAGGCLAAAAFAPAEIGVIARGVAGLTDGAAAHAATAGWVLQPVYSGFSALSPTWLWVVVPGLAAALVLMTLLVSGRRLFTVRRVPVWTSGSAGVRRGHGTGYTSFAFSNPVRKVLGGLLMTRRELRRAGAPAPVPPIGEQAGARRVQLGYVVDVVDVVQRYLYRPMIPAARSVVHAAKRLQSGRLDAYMGYMLIALIAVIAVIVALAPA